MLIGEVYNLTVQHTLFLLLRISINSYDLGCPSKLSSLSNLTQQTVVL